MASGQERILRRRIRSINSTKKITRAMELIAASRIVRAQARVHAAAPYADQITQVVQDLAAAGAASDSPLLVPRPEIRKVAHVVIAADRGLCGGYNSSIFRAAEGEIRAHREQGQDYELVLVDDGSTDGSSAAIEAAARRESPHVVGVLLNRNYGQHAAVIAGFAQARGDVVVTLDGDLQNPPEEIPRLLAGVESGCDIVTAVRKRREDSWFRVAASRAMNTSNSHW